jgi:DNA repair ATPase RecN
MRRARWRFNLSSASLSVDCRHSAAQHITDRYCSHHHHHHHHHHQQQQHHHHHHQQQQQQQRPARDGGERRWLDLAHHDVHELHKCKRRNHQLEELRKRQLKLRRLVLIRSTMQPPRVLAQIRAHGFAKGSVDRLCKRSASLPVPRLSPLPELQRTTAILQETALVLSAFPMFVPSLSW